MGRAIDALLTLFLFASLGVMLAAAGVLIGDLLGFSFSVGVVGTALLTRFLVLGDSTRLLKVNGLLVLMLIALTLRVLVPLVWSQPVPSADLDLSLGTSLIPQNWFIGALLYTSFNVSFALSPLGALGHQVHSRREAFLGALLAGLALAVTGGVILIALLQNMSLIAYEELPILALLRAESSKGVPLYGAVLYLALLTSCIAAAYGLGYRLGKKNTRQGQQISGWLPLLAIPIAYAGFATLVQTLYPLVGYTGLGIVALSILRSKQRRK